MLDQCDSVEQVMKLRANAEALLDNFTGRGSYSNVDTLGQIRVYPEQKLSRNAFFVDLNGQAFVGKIGLAIPGLKELGLTDLHQVASHQAFVMSIFWPAMFCEQSRPQFSPVQISLLELATHFLANSLLCFCS